MGRLAASSLILTALLGAQENADLHLQWVRQLPPRKAAWEFTPKMLRDVAYEPAAAGGQVFVGCEYNGAVLAFDAATGDERWRFYTEGPIRVAPATDGQRVFVGSEDGHLYAFDLGGRLLWKFRGGPSSRKVLAHERLTSAWPVSARPVVAERKVFFVAGYWPLDGIFVHALDPATGKAVWTNSGSQFRPFGSMRVVGKTLFIDGHAGNGAFDVETGSAVAEKPTPREPAAPGPDLLGIKGTVAYRLQADGRIIASTTEGAIYSFGRTKVEPKTHETKLPRTIEHSGRADDYLLAAKIRKGFAVVADLGDGLIVEGLVRDSDLHVIAVDPDAEKVDRLRRKLDSLFETCRLAMVTERSGLPPYLADLVLSESANEAPESLRACLRPYGGAWIVREGRALKVHRREGALAGSDDWMHEFHDPANSLFSRDALVKAPLGVLWYGGPAADLRFYFDGDVDHQSGHGLNPQPAGAEIVDGRMILQGPGIVGAFDIYTGRQLWETPIPRMYTFGGAGGGLGIHSKKYPEPWQAPEAMKSEVPPTHRCRASGFNYTSLGDGIYIAAGEKCLRLRPEDGRKLSEWDVPIAGEKLCWGYLRITGDLLVATAFRPQDMADAQAGHDGNGGDWAGDRMPMAWLLVADRNTGKLLWSRKAEWGFLNRGLAVGNGKVFVADLLLETSIEKFKAAGRSLPKAPPKLYALDLRTGAEKWSADLDIRIQNLVYSEARDLLLVPCRHLMEWKDGIWMQGRTGAFKGEKSAPGKMRGVQGESGKVLWEAADAPYPNPHIILDDLIIDRWGSSYDLLTGKRNLRTSPLTGLQEAWNFPRGGCNHLVASRNLVTWRTAFYDLAGHSGVMKLHGLDAGCSPTLLAAGGVLNIPDFGTHHKRNRMTAMALVHRSENELWTDYSVTVPTQPVQLRRAGYNFGAPGDHVASDGTVWLRVSAKNPAGVAITPKDCQWYTHPSSKTGSKVASTGIIGAAEIAIPVWLGGGKKPVTSGSSKTYRVRLHFAEPEDVAPGARIFSVSIEGRPVLKDFDIAREAGGAAKPVVKEFRGVEIKGLLDVSLSASTGTTVLSGVELESE